MRDRLPGADDHSRDAGSPSNDENAGTGDGSNDSCNAPHRPHDATLRFGYESTSRARAVARAVAQEVGEIDGDRSAATVERDGGTVAVRVVADDLVALRAGCNTWESLVEVAERTSGLA